MGSYTVVKYITRTIRSREELTEYKGEGGMEVLLLHITIQLGMDCDSMHIHISKADICLLLRGYFTRALT